MNNQINYNEEIPKDKFNEFLEVLKVIDPAEYKTESKDNFVDLYNYWTGAGSSRFNLKLSINKEKEKKIKISAK